tara:strand:- start:110 stop:574 length:465 start_codon:yes stop_codon:yes gene_type:complete
MIKRKWFGGIERNLSFVNEVSAGIGLVTGYVLFGLYWLSTPITTVEVTTQTVAYEERVIGYIPEPTRLESISDLGSLNRTVPVTAKFPILNEQGRPALSEEVVTFEGKGTPMIYVEQKGSTPILRTLQRSLIMGKRNVYVEEKKIQSRVQTWCC